MQVINLAPPVSAGSTLIIQGGYNIGDLIWTMRHLAPSNAVALVGALLLISDYPQLWAQVAALNNSKGDNWIDLYGGSGDTGEPTTDTFGTPDFRGEFLRIADGGRGTPSLELGEWQDDLLKAHSHGISDLATLPGASYGTFYRALTAGALRSTTEGGLETRPRAYHVSAFMIFELP